MDFPIHFDTINIVQPIVYVKVSGRIFLFIMYFLSLKIVLILANYADPDKMHH